MHCLWEHVHLDFILSLIQSEHIVAWAGDWWSVFIGEWDVLLWDLYQRFWLRCHGTCNFVAIFGILYHSSTQFMTPHRINCRMLTVKTCQSTQSVHWSILPSIHSSVNPSNCSFVYSSIHWSIRPSIHPFIYMFIHPFTHSSIHPSIDSSIRISIHPSICQCPPAINRQLWKITVRKQYFTLSNCLWSSSEIYITIPIISMKL